MTTLIDRIRTALGRPGPHLKLYSMEYCYYCRRVQSAASRLRVHLETVDVFKNREERDHLLSATGRTRVPVLRIEDGESVRFLPESDDIIEYLETIAARHRNAQPSSESGAV